MIEERIRNLTPDQRRALVENLTSRLRSGTADDRQLTAWFTTSGAALPDEDDLRRHLAQHLNPAVIPRRFVCVEAFPQTTTGKVDRTSVRASRSPSSGKPQASPTGSLTEQRLMRHWKAVLKVDKLDLQENFFHAGGDSLGLIKLVAICQEDGLSVTPQMVHEYPTIASLAESIALLNSKAILPEAHRAKSTATSPPVTLPESVARPAPSTDCTHAVCLSSYTDKPPLFLIPANGFRFGAFGHLAAEISAYTCYSPHTQKQDVVDTMTVDQIVPDLLRQIRSVQPGGPYRLIGQCEGAYAAWDIACELKLSGDEVSFLGILDSPNPTGLKPVPETFLKGVRRRLGTIEARSPFQFVRQLARRTVGAVQRRLRTAVSKELHHTRSGTRMGWLFQPEPYAGHATLFRIVHAAEDQSFQTDFTHGWGDLPTEGLDICAIPGRREDGTDYFLNKENAPTLARRIELAIEAREVPEWV